MPNPTDPPAPWWKLGLKAWLVLFLLALVNVVVFAFDRTTFAWTVTCLYPEYWPVWISYALWCGVALLLLEVPRWSPADRRKLRRVELALFAIILVVFVICLSDSDPIRRFRLRTYHQVYLQYVVGPAARFFTDGYWNWKTFVMPGVGIAALGSLLYLRARITRKKP